MAVARKKTETKAQNYNVEVKRAVEFQSGDIGIDIEVNGVMIYGCTYKTVTNDKGEKGFISFPARKGSDGKYYKYVYFKVSDELLDDIEKQIEAVI